MTFHSLGEKMMDFFIMMFSDDITKRNKNFTDSVMQKRRRNKSVVKTMWISRSDYSYLVCSFFMGISNIWLFPTAAASNGHGTFLILYIIAVFLIGCPMIFLESGFGQFTAASNVQNFSIVPVFSGIWMTQIIFIVKTTIQFSMHLGWSFHYLFNAVSGNMLWNHCNSDFNTPECNSIINPDYEKINSWSNYSPIEYFEACVTGISAINNTFTNKRSALIFPNLGIIIEQFWGWTFLGFLLLLDHQILTKVYMLNFYIPIVGTIFLITKFTFESGGREGIYIFFRPELEYFLKWSSYKEAVKQVVISHACGLGVVINLASYNDYHCNLLKEAVISSIFNMIGTVLAGMLYYSVSVFITQSRNQNVLDLFLRSQETIFYKIMPASVGDSGFNIAWTTVMMLIVMGYTLGVMIGFVTGILISVADLIPTLRNNKRHYFYFIVIMTIVCASISIMLLMPNLVDIYEHLLQINFLVFLAAIQTVALYYTFGHKRIMTEFSNMMGLDGIKYLVMYSIAVVPPILMLIVFADIFEWCRFLIMGDGNLLTIIQVFMVITYLLPIILFNVHYLYVKSFRIRALIAARLFFFELESPYDRDSVGFFSKGSLLSLPKGSIISNPKESTLAFKESSLKFVSMHNSIRLETDVNESTNSEMDENWC